MTTFANTLKSEIARIARKELKVELLALKKTNSAHRSEIVALKREVKALQARVTAGQKLVRAVTPKVEESVAKKPGRRPSFSAKAFAALRAKLGLTQAQMAKLLGASKLSVSKWESGKVQPRSAQLGRILEMRKLGKRKAANLLGEA